MPEQATPLIDACLSDDYPNNTTLANPIFSSDAVRRDVPHHTPSAAILRRIPTLPRCLHRPNCNSYARFGTPLYANDPCCVQLTHRGSLHLPQPRPPVQLLPRRPRHRPIFHHPHRTYAASFLPAMPRIARKAFAHAKTVGRRMMASS